LTQEAPHIPAYLEAFTKGLSDRDKIRGFVLDLISDGVIPEIYDTGFFGITVDVRGKFIEFLNQATDEQMRQAVKCGKKRFG
jgi:hypothetical protein